MIRGRFRIAFAAGVILPLAGLALMFVPMAAAGAALILAGLLAYEHAYVQAGQSVPLA
jgi:hypothetical protein